MRELIVFILLGVLLINPVGTYAQFIINHNLVLEPDPILTLRIHNKSDSTYAIWLDNWRIFMPFEEEIDVHHSISNYPINQLMLFNSPLRIQSSVSYSKEMKIWEGSMKQLAPGDTFQMQLILIAIPKKDQFTVANLQGNLLSYSFSFTAFADDEMDKVNPSVFCTEDLFRFPLICSERFNFDSDNPVIFSSAVQQDKTVISDRTWQRFSYKDSLSFE